MGRSKPTIAIVGASSFIGKYIFDDMKMNYDDRYSVIGTFFSHPHPGMSKLDITNQSAIKEFLLKNQPDYLFLVAGTKDVKKCEEDFRYAFYLNTLPGYLFIRHIEAVSPSTRLIYFSSDYVFDGKRGLYRDDDHTYPQTNYGRTKVSTEILLKNSSVNYKILRPSAVMAKGGLYFDWLVDSLRNNVKIDAFEDIFFSPTPISTLLLGLEHLVGSYESIDEKILHLCGNERMSRFDFSLKMKQLLHSASEITPAKGLVPSTLLQYDLSMVPSTIFQDIPVSYDGLRDLVV